MRCVRLRRTALRANPRMNASTQPSEGAGGSKAKAKSKSKKQKQKAKAKSKSKKQKQKAKAKASCCRSRLSGEGLTVEQSLEDVPI